jgi:hypothetical protein
MKRIIHLLFLAAVIASTQSAWSSVRERLEWLPSPEVESPFPADAEGGLQSAAARHLR